MSPEAGMWLWPTRVSHRLSRLRNSAVAVAGAVAWLATPVQAVAPPIAQASQAAGMNCNLVVGSSYWLCKSLQDRNCNLAERSQYWMCKGLVENNCSLVERADYWRCQALTQRNCNLAERTDYWTCKGLTESCNLSPTEARDFCAAVGDFFRRPRPAG